MTCASRSANRYRNPQPGLEGAEVVRQVLLLLRDGKHERVPTVMKQCKGWMKDGGKIHGTQHMCAMSSCTWSEQFAGLGQFRTVRVTGHLL